MDTQKTAEEQNNLIDPDYKPYSDTPLKIIGSIVALSIVSIIVFLSSRQPSQSNSSPAEDARQQRIGEVQMCNARYPSRGVDWHECMDAIN